MAQLALDQTTEQPQLRPRLRVSMEALLYGGLLLLALLLRLASLGVAPLDDLQAHDALAAYHRVAPQLPAEGSPALYPLNALGALFNSVALLLLGNSNFAVRLPTALAGSLLVLLPLLYRGYLGRLQALLLALGFTVSGVALAASRTMGGMVWAMALLLIGGWFALRFIHLQGRRDALAMGLCAAGVLLLTSPYGGLLLLGLFFGLLLALVTDSDATRQQATQLSAALPGIELFAVAGGAVLLITTSFMTVPGGLSSIGQVTQSFLEGFSTLRPGFPRGYALLVALRYDGVFVLFGLLGTFAAAKNGGFYERFLVGWFMWGLLVGAIYPGASADLALLILVPALGLSASFIQRMLQNLSYGFWHVPGWVLPVHALIVAAFLASLTVNLQSLSVKLLEEARPNPFAEVLTLNNPNSSAHIGTIAPDSGGSSMSISLPTVELRNCVTPEDPSAPIDEQNFARSTAGKVCERVQIFDMTLHVFPLSAGAESAQVLVKDLNGTSFYDAPLGEDFLVYFTAPAAGEYRVDVLRGPQSPPQALHYGINVYAGDLTQSSGTDWLLQGGFQLNLPITTMLVRIFGRAPNPYALLSGVTMLLLLPISYFLVGAFYGGRVAWRGLALGLLLVATVFGVSLGWQASTTYGGNGRELWHLSDATPDLHSLPQVLREMSLRATGTDDEVAITAQVPPDGAIAWALRDFHNTRYVEAVSFATDTPIVILPDTLRPTMAADYIGQQLVMGYDWQLKDLHWTDFGAWWFSRRTRFPLQAQERYRLWVERSVYDVQSIPGG